MTDLASLQPARVFDGGDLDCGSGLVLLIRENMAQVPEGEVLEMRSCEPSVRDDLPPWCRMVGHEYLGALPAEGAIRYFIRRRHASPEAAAREEASLAGDKGRAKEYEWRVRVRATGPLRSRCYCRNFAFEVGQAASFEERDEHPSAVELLLGALGGDLVAGFRDQCARAGIELDDLELTLKAKLVNVLAHVGLETGDPSLRGIEGRCFASTSEDEEKVRSAWEVTLARSPLCATLRKAAAVEVKLAIV